MKILENQVLSTILAILVALVMLFSAKIVILDIVDEQVEGYITTCEQGVQTLSDLLDHQSDVIEKQAEDIVKYERLVHLLQKKAKR